MSEHDEVTDQGAGAQPAPGSLPGDVRVTDKRLKMSEPSDDAVVEPSPESELEKAKTEAAGYLDDLRRLKAEFENYRKRVLKEQTVVTEQASIAVIEKLLPVLDNFELALIAADRTKDYEALVRGVELVFGEFQGMLRKEGLKRIDAEGKPFDPAQHDAVMEGEGSGETAVVGEVFRNGYTLKGRVIRPAMVKVERR